MFIYYRYNLLEMTDTAELRAWHEAAARSRGRAPEAETPGTRQIGREVDGEVLDGGM